MLSTSPPRLRAASSRVVPAATRPWRPEGWKTTKWVSSVSDMNRFDKMRLWLENVTLSPSHGNPAPARHVGLGEIDRHRRVAAVGIGADRLREALRHRRAADHDEDVVAQTFVLQRLDDDLHIWHRRRQQRAHPHDIGPMLLHGVEELLG